MNKIYEIKCVISYERVYFPYPLNLFHTTFLSPINVLQSVLKIKKHKDIRGVKFINRFLLDSKSRFMSWVVLIGEVGGGGKD